MVTASASYTRYDRAERTQVIEWCAAIQPWVVQRHIECSAAVHVGKHVEVKKCDVAFAQPCEKCYVLAFVLHWGGPPAKGVLPSSH